MRQVWVAIVAAAVLLLSLPSFGQVEVGQGVVLDDSRPIDQPTDQWAGEVTGDPMEVPPDQPGREVTGEPRVAEESVSAAPEHPMPPPTHPALPWQTRPGIEDATRQVFEGKFALKEHAHPSTSTSTSSVKVYTTERVIEKPVEKPVVVGPPPVNIFNFTAPPADQTANNQPLPAAQIREERKTKMIGWVILGLTVAATTAIAIYAIASTTHCRVEEQQTRQAQAAQLGTALTNQAPFTPAQGRLVSISTSIFPTGGGIVRATSDERPAPPPPAPAPAAPAPYAVMMTAPAWQTYLAAQQVVVAPPAGAATP